MIMNSTINPALFRTETIGKILFLRAYFNAAITGDATSTHLPHPRYRTHTMTGSVTKPQLMMTEMGFLVWLDQAQPGERMEYHRGFIARDTYPLCQLISAGERKQLQTLTNAAFECAQAGRVHLVQARLGLDHFSYIAVARAPARHPGASMPPQSRHSATLLQH